MAPVATVRYLLVHQLKLIFSLCSGIMDDHDDYRRHDEALSAVERGDLEKLQQLISQDRSVLGRRLVAKGGASSRWRPKMVRKGSWRGCWTRVFPQNTWTSSD